MFVVPKVKFGDVVKEVKNKIDRNNNPYEYYVAGDHMDSEDLTIHRRGCFATDDVGPAFIREFRKGQVLYGSRRTYLKKVAVADFDGVTANTTFVLETKDQNVLLQELLPFIMLTDNFTKWSIGKSKGSTNPYILFSDLADYEFDLPTIEEQRKLATVLWKMFRLKEGYVELQHQSDQLVQSQFIEMFGDCEAVPISTMGTVITGGTPSKKNASYYSSPDIPFYKPNDFSDNSIIELDVSSEFVSEKAREVADIFPQGSVLVTCIGTIGKIGILTKEATCNQQINVIIPNQAKCYSEFIAYAIWCNRQRLMSIANATTVTIINKSNFENFEIPCPSIELQKAFVALCQQFDKSKFAAKQALENLERTQKSLMNRYLG